MVKKSKIISSIFLVCLLILSFFPKPSMGYFDVDLAKKQEINPEQVTGLINFDQVQNENPLKRYLVFGSGQASNLLQKAHNVIYGIDSKKGSFVVGLFDQNEISSLKLNGYDAIEDMPLEFDSQTPTQPVDEVSRVDKILGSYSVLREYGYNGNGIKIGIVDTGTDFSNPDMKDSVARDKFLNPLMVDADGQGIVITNSTFVANINEKGVIQNFSKPIPKNVTSVVYLNSQGVFLSLSKGGKGTFIQAYNSNYPKGGTTTINGTVSNDYKIGSNSKQFIVSKSGIYHFGMIYESISQGQFSRLELVPVLVVDANIPGSYDTIIPDMSDSWKDFNKFDSSVTPKYDFDFTDESPIMLGGGNENLVYDSNHDGIPDYSAGTVGAQVLDVYGVITKPSLQDKKIGAVNGTLLPAMDPKGNFFGVMFDFEGHGTAAAASIVSAGKQKYDIYSNSTQYRIKGVAPGAKIVPIKALWLGDAIYGWLWAAGFNQENNKWKFSGNTNVDIISNSWGISTFPVLQSVPGLDIQSLLLSMLNVPHSLEANYPGILAVSSAGNAGPGYGTMGIPDAAPYGITVGAVTDQVFVGYGPFKFPRFGNDTAHYGEISGFSSKGPSLIGDPKPDLMAVGEYSYTPISVTKFSKNSTSFGLFGGTSLSSPLVAGSAAVLMQSLKDKDIPYDPFTVKNILMSTATDLKNDPFTQGTGLVNVTRAVDFALGKSDSFIVFNNASYANTKKILDSSFRAMNSSFIGLDNAQLPNSSLPETSWFGGRLFPGDRTSATFTIVNPTNSTIDVQVDGQKLDLIKSDIFNGTTQPRLLDPIINKSGVYSPNFIPLAEIKNHNGFASFFEKTNPIPNDASLLVLDLAFPFSQFMNSSAKTYADDLKISSVYLYDWNTKNDTSSPNYKNLSLVNRGGSWGTTQELRVSDPASKIQHIPLVGVYPVPTRFSYWTGDTRQNSTSLNYTISANYYKKTSWNELWFDSKEIQIPPYGSANVLSTLIVPPDKNPGLYQGFITFKEKTHTVSVPISYAVIKKLQAKDLPTVIVGQTGDALFGNGYIGGGFDMSNRYNAGDWREYYFDVNDKTINSIAMNISWKDPNTNLSVFVVDPQGRIVQTNFPPGVLGQFQGWPSGDWLGPSASFSEGGGFFPVKNKDPVSTVLYAPINQTGVYSVLIHAPLFGGESISEPVTITTKFSTILPEESPPEIILDVPLFINHTHPIMPTIIGENIQDEKYYLDDKKPQEMSQGNLVEDMNNLLEGEHNIRFVVTDTVGHLVSNDFKFILDNTPPIIIVKSPTNDSTVSGIVNIDLDVSESNPAQKDWLIVKTPTKTIHDTKNIQFDTKGLTNGQYEIEVIANDRAGNLAHCNIMIKIDNSPNSLNIQNNIDQNFITLVVILVGIGIASIITIFTFKKFKISKIT